MNPTKSVYVLITQVDDEDFRIITNPDGSVWTFDTLKQARAGQEEIGEIHEVETSIIKLNLKSYGDYIL